MWGGSYVRIFNKRVLYATYRTVAWMSSVWKLTEMSGMRPRPIELQFSNNNSHFPSWTERNGLRRMEKPDRKQSGIQTRLATAMWRVPVCILISTVSSVLLQIWWLFMCRLVLARKYRTSLSSLLLSADRKFTVDYYSRPTASLTQPRHPSIHCVRAGLQDRLEIHKNDLRAYQYRVLAVGQLSSTMGS